MDGKEAVYDADSARVWEGVLVLLKAVKLHPVNKTVPTGSLRKRKNLPVANIREWSDDS
jgi:hypothetical protein